ncbi:hypothetical protein QUA40_09655 [Microcoleus sp. Pol11C3]|uniref:hypothetical protein n=1 Tax=Microcoleus sp. Pol11C3 TaxID=3055390 RepID=UPI002FD1CC15
MSATCQIPLIAFYGRSGSMLHEIERKRGSAIGVAQFEDDACEVSRLLGKYTGGRDAHPTV